MGIFYEEVKERMIRYARINTQSARFTGTWPTTERQFDLARLLGAELREIGASDVYLDPVHCVVYGKIPATVEVSSTSPVGFIAHMDTAPDASGEIVRPWVLENYDGSDIVLNPEKGIVIRAVDYPVLSNYIGQDLILTDGTTLLGGDDKASIAAIMTMASYYCAHPEIPHGLICLAFTPDEEVGGLAHTLDLARFGSPVAYTLDGDHLGWYEDETFNASGALLRIRGRSVHTGTAKGIMINAADIASAFMQMLPPHEKPQFTEKKEGFYHVVSCNATCEEAEVYLIVRDFDRDAFERRERSSLTAVRAEFLSRAVRRTSTTESASSERRTASIFMYSSTSTPSRSSLTEDAMSCPAMSTRISARTMRSISLPRAAAAPSGNWSSTTLKCEFCRVKPLK